MEDWYWLLEKFEFRINHWCNRTLSLGGSYILIKSVLESLPIYWLALAYVPISILNKIRQNIFSFLWTGYKKKNCFHLCKWELLSKPKQYGGWGFQNLYLSYRALASNTLWRVLMKPGIWNKVIKDKYLPHAQVVDWLRTTSNNVSYGSQTWKNLLNSLSLILQWLAWNPGSGQSIVIGRDYILGLGKYSLLSEDLIQSLNHKRIYVLYQARCNKEQGAIGTNWLTSSVLELEGDTTREWESYRLKLIGMGIHLQDRPDVLIWTGGDNSGKLSVKNVYNVVAAKLWVPKGEWLEEISLEMGLPIKIKVVCVACCRRQDPVMEKPSEKGVGRSRHMPPV
jgi:hypothetical protein